MILYEPFYRKFGVHKRESLATPPISSTVGAQFPRAPMIHYIPDGPTDVGPDENWWMIRNPEGAVYVHHVEDIVQDFGKVTRGPGSFTQAITLFHRSHRKLNKIVSLATALNNLENLVVVNYGMATQFAKYTTNRNLEYQRNANLRLTVWNNVAEWLGKTDRQQWIPITMPRALPSLQTLIKADRRFDQEMIGKFSAMDKQFLYDLWLWCGEDREKSAINKIPVEHYNRVNLVLMVGEFWTTVNLEQIDVFRKSEKYPKANMTGEVFQRRILRGVMSLLEYAFASESEAEKEDKAKKPESGTQKTTPLEETEEDLSEDQNFWETEVPTNLLDPTANPLANKSLTAPKSTLTKSSKSSTSGSGTGKSEAEFQEDDSVFDDGSGATSKELTDEAIEKDLAALNEVDAIQSKEVVQTIINPNEDPLVAGITNRAKALVRAEVISGAEYRRLLAQAEKYKTIKNPFGPGLLHEAMVVTEEEVKVEEKTFKVAGRVFDESLLKSTHPDLTAKYVKGTLHKHVAQNVLSIQRAGVVVSDLTMDRLVTTSGSTEVYKAKFHPIGGASTTFTFTLPTVEEDGTFKTGGTQYRLSWQRGDLPLRKVTPHRVVLTSAYGKINIIVSDRSIFNYERWLQNAIGAAALEEGSGIAIVRRGNVFDYTLKAPKSYSLVSRAFHLLSIKGMDLNFKHSDLISQYQETLVNQWEKHGERLLVGFSGKNPVVVTQEGVYQIIKGEAVVDLGYFEDICGLDRSKASTEVAMIKVLGQQVALGVAMAYYIGLGNLLQLLRIEHRRVLAKDRLNLQPHESSIRFSDETLVYSTRDIKGSMLISGFKFYKDQCKETSIYAFDKQGVYVDILDASARNTRYTGELNLLKDMFVDPICEEMLKRMKEPTTWFPLLMRAADLLSTEQSPDEMDGAEMVFRGYSRFPGAVYKEMINSLRKYNQKQNMAKTGIDINPSAVWMSVTNDPAVRIYDDSNPIQQLRSDEIVTYIGEGGRSKRTMVAKTRKFHKNDEGTVAEAGVDSGDVGINIYLTANPQITDTFGNTKRYDYKEGGATPMVSTTALIGPALDVDDPKRVVFATIQHGSGIAAVGYKPMPYRTGMDEALAHRNNRKYAYVATAEGEVQSIKGGVMRIRYDDGSITAVEIGRVYVKGAGHTYPAELAVTVKVGDHVSEGDVLAFNTSWFEQDYFNPRHVVYKAGVLCRVALFEAPVTHEDSSEFSTKIAQALRTYETIARHVTLPFETEVREIAMLGQQLQVDSILCVLEDSTSTAAGLFDETTIDSLKLLVNNNPTAKVAGSLDRIEVVYNGDIEDMSQSLREIAEVADSAQAKHAKAMGKGAENCRNTESLRIDGQPLQLNTIVITFHITYSDDAYTGDKTVFCNQMKSVAGGVMAGINETESGLELDAIFSDTSNEARLVRSSRKGGMYNSLLRRIGRNFVANYRG